MGADIYLQSENDRKHAELKCDELGEKLETLRKTSPKSPEFEEARKAWTEANDKANEGTYYRDSYNSSNLAWILGLSYWQEGQHCDEETGKLPIERVKHWHKVVSEANIRQCVIDAVANSVANSQLPKGTPPDKRNKPELVMDESENVDQVVAYFEAKQKRFTALLAKAIELNEPLGWSV